MSQDAYTAAALAALNIASTAVENKKSYKYSKRLMSFQNELNKENWNMVNDYNLPRNERARLQQAGINPNFGIGSSQAQQVSAVSPQSFNYNSPLRGISDGVRQGLEIKQMGAQFKQTQAQTEYIKAQKGLAEQQTANLVLDNQRGMFQYGLDMVYSGAERSQALNNFIVQGMNAIKSGNLTDAEYAFTKMKTLLAPREVDIAQQNADSNTANALTNARNAEINQQNADTASGNLALSRERLAFDRQVQSWVQSYNERKLSLDKLNSYYTNQLNDAIRGLTESNKEGVDIENGIRQYDADLREYVATLGLDKQREVVLLGNLRQIGFKTQQEINNLKSDKNLTDAQRTEINHRIWDNHMNAAANAVNTALKSRNPFGGQDNYQPQNINTTNVSWSTY